MEAASDQRFCRACGANLKIIAKAVSLGEAIARSDRGPLPKLKAAMKEFKMEQATHEVSRALDKMNEEIVSGFPKTPKKKEKPPEVVRENHIALGLASLGAGIGIMIFLRYFAYVVIPLIPPETLAKIPFALEPVLRAAWLVGLIPALAGTGRVIGGVLMRRERARELKAARQAPELTAHAHDAEAAPEVEAAHEPAPPHSLPPSITENTTDFLDGSRKAPASQGQ
jgi:hypothetical protein